MYICAIFVYLLMSLTFLTKTQWEQHAAYTQQHGGGLKYLEKNKGICRIIRHAIPDPRLPPCKAGTPHTSRPRNNITPYILMLRRYSLGAGVVGTAA